MSNNIFFERGQMADKPNNYLWNGDCLELMKDIPDKSINAIICDLPYGTTACKWDIVIPFEPLWEQYERLIKKDGAIVLFGSEPFSSFVRMSNLPKYKYDWKWNKRNGGNPFLVKKRPIMNYEDVMIFGTPKTTYNYQIDKSKLLNKLPNRKPEERQSEHFNNYKWNNKRNVGYPKAIIDFKTTQWKKKHPTEKPLELLKYLVKTYTNENDWVLDNTCGSNTTGVACYDLNRNYIGIEKNKDFYKVAKKRMEENILLRANKPKTLFEQ